MATVTFLEPTDMSVLSSSFSSQTVWTVTGVTQGTGWLELHSDNGFTFDLYGTFEYWPGDVVGTETIEGTAGTIGNVSRVFIDTPDGTDAPNIDIQGINDFSFEKYIAQHSVLYGRFNFSLSGFEHNPTGSDGIGGFLSGDDTFSGTSGPDTIINFTALTHTLTDGHDALDGGAGADILSGGTDSDYYFVDNPGDVVIEAPGAGSYDRVFASVSYNLAPGVEIEALSTSLYAGTDAINLRGNEFGQVVAGNAGTNFLSGGGGNDTLFGFGGNDYFLFEQAPTPGNVAQIADFTIGEDHMLLLRAAFTSLPTGTLPDANFMVRGTALQDANHFIVYDPNNGAVYYDADGSGAGAAVQFATVTPGLALHASDILVV